MKTIKTYGPSLKTFFYHESLPEDTSSLKGIVLVLPGLEGHGGRYTYLGEILNENGYGMFSVDHIGHGQTALDEKELGDWFAKDFEKSALNAYYIANEIKIKFPGVPLFLLGNDFGGYFTQYMVERFYRDIKFDGMVLSSCGKNNIHQYKLYLLSVIKKKLFHDRFRSYDTHKRRTSRFSKPFQPIRTTYDWMSSDEEEVDNFIIDPKCGFVGTIGYYHEYYSNVIRIPEYYKFRGATRDLPILFMGGKDDTVTRNGKDITKLHKYYNKIGFMNTSINFYDGARHDLFFEKNKDEIIQDFINWLNIQTGHIIYTTKIDLSQKEADINLLRNDKNF